MRAREAHVACDECQRVLRGTKHRDGWRLPRHSNPRTDRLCAGVWHHNHAADRANDDTQETT